jgi:hypothetical protein
VLQASSHYAAHQICIGSKSKRTVKRQHIFDSCLLCQHTCIHSLQHAYVTVQHHGREHSLRPVMRFSAQRRREQRQPAVREW